MIDSSASSARRATSALIASASPVRTDLEGSARHAQPVGAQFAAKDSLQAMAIAKSVDSSSIASSSSAPIKDAWSARRGTTLMKVSASHANKLLPGVTCATRQMLALSVSVNTSLSTTASASVARRSATSTPMNLQAHASVLKATI